MKKFSWSDKNLKASSTMIGINLKKLSSLGIIFLLLTSTFLIFVPKIESQNRFSGSGSGTPEDPYVITNVKQLQEMKYNLSAHYVLGNDIDASETKFWNDEKGFEPIGHYFYPFTGTFDGRGFKIYNLYINVNVSIFDEAREFVGLFGYVGERGIIKNVGLENVTILYTGEIAGQITVTGRVVGGLIGWNLGTVSNCYSTGIVSGKGFVGGLIGYNVGSVSNSYSTASVYGGSNVGGLIGANSGTVSNSYSTGTVNGEREVGGLIGYNNGEVSNSYSTALVNGKYHVGGLIGENVGKIFNSYSTGTVNGDTQVGGLVGYNDGSVSNSYSVTFVNGKVYVGGLIGVGGSYSIVSNCYSTGTVKGNYSVGGLIGGNWGKVSKCYSTGTVYGQNQTGGLIGYNNGEVSTSYSAGSVYGQEEVGGLIGFNDDGGKVSNCYSRGTVKGQNLVGGLIGLNKGGGRVSNCYSTGPVKGNKNVGGLIGFNFGTVSNSFWDIETSGLKTSAGGTGKTTSEMKNVRTYTDVGWSKGLESPWDFVGNPYDDKGNEDIWDINPNINDGYPYLTAIPPPAPAPSPACIIESISVSNTGTVIINGVTYPVLDVVIKASKGCGDNINVIKVIPEKDPMDKQPALSCSLISKTSRNDISERTYRCTAKWNYLTSPDQISFAIKTILASIIASPGLTIGEKINFVVSKLSASTLEKPVILYNATFSLQLDSSNAVDLTIQAPKSKINAIGRYLYVKTLSTYILYITPVITGTCLVDIITDKTCIVVSAAMLSIGTLSYFALQKQAYDPYNEDYTSIFEAPPPSDKIKELANVYGDIIYDLYYYVNYINASMISLSRAFTAYEKGDYQWYNKQLSKASEYAEKSLTHFDKIKVFLNNELTKIEPYINKEMFDSGLNYIEKYGLQKEVAEILKELGIFKHVNVTEVVDIAKTLGYSEIKPREIIEVMVSTGEDVKNYVKILEKEIPTTTPTQTSPTPLVAMPLNIELIIILIAIVAILASLVIVIRKYKTK
ncbi:MAG: GLUG motif-containing protein [Thermoproteota archaeon]|jgi:transcription termination factor NusB|nr:GLUG motif-containing protein [Thermoproteota archaeon]